MFSSIDVYANAHYLIEDTELGHICYNRTAYPSGFCTAIILTYGMRRLDICSNLKLYIDHAMSRRLYRDCQNIKNTLYNTFSSMLEQNMFDAEQRTHKYLTTNQVQNLIPTRDCLIKYCDKLKWTGKIK